jgi:galactose mutarotase-like enzyme
MAPVPCSDYELEWLYTFGGGLVTTCGLSHVGGPECDDHGTRGLHGRYSNLPAQIESVIQPDPGSGKLDFSITATILESKVFGPHLRMRRTLSGVLGEPTIKIQDDVTNLGNTPAPHMLLYHINFGWPLVDDGAAVVYRGQFKSRGLPMDDATFAVDDVKQCRLPQESHTAGGEGCGFIDPKADKDGRCAAAIVNRKLNLAATINFRKDQLPCLVNWQHWGPGEYVCALEPGTNFPIGQKAARKAGTLIELEPGQSRRYDVKIKVLSETNDINVFVKQWG